MSETQHSTTISPGPGPLTGRQLDHYRVGDRLAGGTMGEVYAAYDTALERPVAIKTVRPELVRDEVQRALFLREAQAQARIVHPHVAQVYFAGVHDGVPFVAMQLLEGGSLADLLAAGRRLGWQDALHHMRSVAEGLAEAARLGVSHRDVKPANILLDRAGEAHLADFGLGSRGSRPWAAPADAAQAAPPPGAAPGTPEYLSPEQVRGGPLDARTDVYGLGATFYHLLAGRPPLPAATLQEAEAAPAGPPPRRLHQVAPDVPRRLARVVDRCLERDPARRYRDARELAEALRRVDRPPGAAVRALVRSAAWLVDLAPAAVVLRYTYLTFPAAALLVELALVAVTAWALGSPPGEWLVRLRLRTARGEQPSPGRAVLRTLFHCGWLLPLGLFLQATYGGASAAEAWGLAALAWAGVSLLGSLGVLAGRGRTLHDWASGVRVLVDSR